MNIKQLAYKLQTALCQKGRYIKINQQQMYSERSERMVTKYVLQEKCVTEKGAKNHTLLETFQLVDVVKFLAKELGDMSEPDA